MSGFEQNVASIPAKEVKKGGAGKCCGIGCFVLLLIVGGLCAAGFYWAKNTITDLTEEKAVPIEAPQATPQQVSDVFTRFDTFREAIATGKPSGPLVLSDQDINLLMYHHNDFEAISGKSQVKIGNDKLLAKISLKLDEFPDLIAIPVLGGMLKGRYVNGDATISLSLKDGKPNLFLEGLSANGMVIPPEVIKGLQKENILEKVADDENFSKIFEKIEEIKIENNKLHIIPKK